MENIFKRYWKRFLKGTATSEEIKYLSKSIDKEKNSQLVDEFLSETWTDSREKSEFSHEENEKKKAIWQKIKTETYDGKQVKTLLNFRNISVAASIAFLIGFSVWFINYQNSFVTLKVEAGIAAEQFVLPDGSKVWLNSASKLKYRKDFNEDRWLKLNGEAFFEVVKNNRSPFRVEFNSNKLEVTGTQFNINAYKTDNLSAVHVKEGSVNVLNKKNTASLIFDDYLIVNNKSGKFDQLNIPFSKEMGWKNGTLFFENTPFSKVLKIIERRFAVEFNYEDGVRNNEIKITATYTPETSIEEIITGLTLITPYAYDINPKKKIIIKPKN